MKYGAPGESPDRGVRRPPALLPDGRVPPPDRPGHRATELLRRDPAPPRPAHGPPGGARSCGEILVEKVQKKLMNRIMPGGHQKTQSHVNKENL